LQTSLARISCELVERTARTAIASLQALAIENPMIGVFGINPHAGENRLFGHDDERITVPAVEKLKSEGLRIEGLVGADLMLGRREIDAFVAMYHDQGHIPVKLLAGRHCGSMSIGAGVTFASVGHGSAFDIPGRGIAEPDAVLRSIQLVGGSTRFEGSGDDVYYLSRRHRGYLSLRRE
jgi:4-hydroxythreonine-4-phosphate dehydrogenase